MPLHRIYHTPGQFTQAEKDGLADAITKIYTEKVHLPAFYVIVLFIPLEVSSFYVGGKPNSKFVRITVQHIARSFDSSEIGAQFLQMYEDAIAPFIKEKGYDWEVAIEQVDRNLWRANGLIPPQSESEGEKLWVKTNKAVPY